MDNGVTYNFNRCSLHKALSIIHLLIIHYVFIHSLKPAFFQQAYKLPGNTQYFACEHA